MRIKLYGIKYTDIRKFTYMKNALIHVNYSNGEHIRWKVLPRYCDNYKPELCCYDLCSSS